MARTDASELSSLLVDVSDETLDQHRYTSIHMPAMGSLSSRRGFLPSQQPHLPTACSPRIWPSQAPHFPANH